jgi:hypothetical protein
MSWFNGKSARQLAGEINENQQTIMAMREGLSKPVESERLRSVVTRHMHDLEAETEAMRDQLVSEPLVYNRDCSFCIGKCKGH